MPPLPGTEDHPHAAAVLGAALPPGGAASHAYLFHGPAGAGKAAAARAFAVALLCDGSRDPDGARARVEHGTHTDLTWVTPSGAHELLVADVDPVIATAWHTPFESRRRVFVIERADTLGEQAGNKLLKTLEEPPSFAHLILLTDRLGEVMPTIASRCQLVRFDAPAPGRIAERLAQLGVAEEAADACARLALGDLRRAQALATGDGPALRAAAEAYAAAALDVRMGEVKPWEELDAVGRRRGKDAVAVLDEQLAAELELLPKRDRRKRETEHGVQARRVERRVRTESLDLGLQLVGLWFRDLACLAWESADLVHHTDRFEALEAAAGPAPEALRRAIELVDSTRVSLTRNVSEELALEALGYRLERTLQVVAAGSAPVRA